MASDIKGRHGLDGRRRVIRGAGSDGGRAGGGGEGGKGWSRRRLITKMAGQQFRKSLNKNPFRPRAPPLPLHNNIPPPPPPPEVTPVRPSAAHRSRRHRHRRCTTSTRPLSLHGPSAAYTPAHFRRDRCQKI